MIWTLAHPPIGDVGGIQTYIGDAARALGPGARLVGSTGRIGPTRVRRLWVRLRTFARSFLSIFRNRAVLIVGHLSLVELAPLSVLAKQTLVVFYGRELESIPSGKRLIWQWFERRGLVRFVSISATTTELAAECGWTADKWFLVNPVFEPHTVRASPRARRRDEPLRMVTVARLAVGSERKNVDELIRSVAVLRDSGTDALLEIVGDGDLRDDLVRLAADLGVSDAVTFRGWLSEAAKRNCLEAAHCFVLPSTQEGFGIVVLEAWHAGLAVVGSNQRALAEIINDGIDGLTPEANAESIAEATRTLLSDTDRLSLARRGQQSMEKHLGLDKMRDALLASAAGPSTRQRPTTNALGELLTSKRRRPQAAASEDDR